MVVLALTLGALFFSSSAQATPPPPSGRILTGHSLAKLGPDVLDIMHKGYSLTKGHTFGHVASNTLLNAQNSPLDDPYAPIVNGADNPAAGCFSGLGDCYTRGSY